MDPAFVLEEKIRNHSAIRIRDALLAYNTSKNILFHNTHQLRHIVQVLEDPKDKFEIFSLKNRPKRNALFEGVIQHFHNYLASVVTLIDHMRNLMGRQFISAAHRQEYQKCIDTHFASDPLARFLKELRNYTLHSALPVTNLSQNLLTGVIVFQLNLDELVSSDFRWSSLAKQFIMSRKPQVRVLALIDEYERKVGPFHTQFVSMFLSHYAQGISEVDDFIKSRDEILGKSM